MEKTHDSVEKAKPSEDPSAQPPSVKRAGWFVRTFKFVAAVEAWKRQFGILRNRGSFPLLREVANNRVTSTRVLIPTAEIADEFIDKSLWGHKLIFFTSLLAFLYSGYRFVIGLALALKFNMPFNLWLWLSISIMIFTGFQMLLSYRVHSAMKEEKMEREFNSQSAIDKGVHHV
jgi:hypothetical protein